MSLLRSSRDTAFQVTRTIPLPGVRPETLERLAHIFGAIEPVTDVHAGAGRLRLRYDASVLGFREIERLLDEAGVKQPTGLWWRFRAAWYRFLDANARSNALSRGGACCSRPPSPWRGGDDQERGR